MSCMDKHRHILPIYIHTYIHAYIFKTHTYIHTIYIHTYKHTYTNHDMDE